MQTWNPGSASIVASTRSRLALAGILSCCFACHPAQRRDQPTPPPPTPLRQLHDQPMPLRLSHDQPTPPPQNPSSDVSRLAEQVVEQCGELVSASQEATTLARHQRAMKEAIAKESIELLAKYCELPRCSSSDDRLVVLLGLSSERDFQAFQGKLREDHSWERRQLDRYLSELSRLSAFERDAQFNARLANEASSRCVAEKANAIAFAYSPTAIPRSSWHGSYALTKPKLVDEANVILARATASGFAPLRWCRFRDGFVAYSALVEAGLPPRVVGNAATASVALAIPTIRQAIASGTRIWFGAAFVVATDVAIENDEGGEAWRVLASDDCGAFLPSDLRKKARTKDQRRFEFLFVYERSDPYRGPYLVTVTQDTADLLFRAR